VVLNTLDPSDPSIFGMLDALGSDDDAPETPAAQTVPAPAEDPFAQLAELGDDGAGAAQQPEEDPFALLSAFDDDPAKAAPAAENDPFALLADLGDDDDTNDTNAPPKP
jgi:hypothetical protein